MTMGRVDEETLWADGIQKSYGAVLALHGFSCTARAGEVLGILGPNGAGKTTAIRILTTILPAGAGAFTIAGIPGSQPARIRERIGVLPESAGYPEQQTGLEFLTYFGQLFGQRHAAARAKAEGLLGEIGLDDRASAPIGTYSRGMRQRLGIVRALINDPAVIFFDEPTLGLDPAGQRQVLRLISEIARERGTTVVLSTHLLGEVEEICSGVVILNKGTVVADGTVAEVTRRAGAARRARIRVPAELRDRALNAVVKTPDVDRAELIEDRSDAFALTFAEEVTGPSRSGSAIARVVEGLTEAGVPVLGFELEGARLSEAFLAMTESGAG
jgi:ABC-2 type transport system ATP-binding protein